MSWKETCYMNERVKFIAEYVEDEESIAELCRKYGVSRKTGYKWIGRFESQGPQGLRDRSRAPKRHPNAIAPEIEEAIVALRRKKMSRGPLKILALLAGRTPRLALPCASAVADILRRRGLSVPRRKRRHATPSARSFPSRLEPVEYDDEWTARSVRTAGQIKWRGRKIYVSQALAGERVGFEPVGDGLWRIHFARYPLGLFDERHLAVRPLARACDCGNETPRENEMPGENER